MLALLFCVAAKLLLNIIYILMQRETRGFEHVLGSVETVWNFLALVVLHLAWHFSFILHTQTTWCFNRVDGAYELYLIAAGCSHQTGGNFCAYFLLCTSINANLCILLQIHAFFGWGLAY